MDQEKRTEALDELISDILDLIDEKDPAERLAAAAKAAEEASAAEEIQSESVAEELPAQTAVSEAEEIPTAEEVPVAEAAAEEPFVPEVPAADVSEPEEALQNPQKEKRKKSKKKKKEENPSFQDQRWTDRQRVPKHVARLQQNQEEAYARWLEEQQEKGDEPPPDLPDETVDEGGKGGSGHNSGKKKHRGLKWFCIILAVLTLLSAAAMVFFVPEQPITADIRDRTKGIGSILVAGTDDSMGRTEALLLLSFNTRNKTMSVIGLPVDIMVESHGRVMPLGEVYGRSGGGAEGLEALKLAVGDCVGLVPDGCLVLYPDAVVDFVDALGTAKFEAPYEVKTKAISLSKGQARLTGAQAYALLCHTDETVDEALRLQTQERFLAAVIRQCTGFGSVLKAPVLLDRLTENAVTDLTTRNMLWLARTALLMDHDKTHTATLPGVETEDGFAPDVEEVLSMVNTYCNPYIGTVKAEDLCIMDPETAYNEP